MSFLQKLFGKNEKPLKSNEDFWNWFTKNEKTFYKVVQQEGDIQKVFFDKLKPRLDELKEDIFYLTGCLDTHTVELILTAEGNVKNIFFVEELVKAAPDLKGWKFTALKPALSIEDIRIDMAGITCGKDTLSFFPNPQELYPDEIDITVVHKDLTEENRSVITNATYIFLDNCLGELNFVSSVDTVSIVGPANIKETLISIEKLKDYIIWREKEFVEKYEGFRHQPENDNYGSFEARLKNGKPLLAVINTDLLEWEGKVSYPWILDFSIKFNGSKGNGMPDEFVYQQLDEIEAALSAELPEQESYLNIGRQTADGVREIYFCCKDFRKPSKAAYAIAAKYNGRFEFSFEIYKDKYWQSFNRFMNAEVLD